MWIRVATALSILSFVACGSVSDSDVDAGPDIDARAGSPDARPDAGGSAVCGNEIVEAGEDCDDGNADEADACLSTCVDASCGDGFVHEGVEACDDGAGNGDEGCDQQCALQFYTGSNETCPSPGLLMCGFFNAECRVDSEGGGGGMICYWPGPVTTAACDGTPGIWTAHDSGFAQSADHMTFPPPGVCITQFTDLLCSVENRDTCAANSATGCFREKAPDGSTTNQPSLCWWDVSEAGCANTAGIWTTQDSAFAQGHPNSLPPGEDACITQVTNLN